MKKKNLLILSLIITISLTFSFQLFSQTTEINYSLRHYLGQSKPYIIKNFQYCHIENEEKTLSFICDDAEYTMGIKDGLSFSIMYMPKIKSKASSKFSLEIKLLKDHGWKTVYQTTDEYGNIKYTFKKDNKCVWCFFMPTLGWLGFQICND